MLSKTPFRRRFSCLVHLRRFLPGAVAVVALSGCYGDSEFGYSDQYLADTNAQSSLGSEEAFGDEYWAELAQEYEEFVPEPGFSAAVDPEDYVSLGLWGELIEWPEIAVGAANMADGRIVTWASYVDDDFGASTESTTASIYNPETGVFEDAGYTGHNLFCAGISMLDDGRVFLAGGGLHVSTVSVFEDNQFREIDSMAMARWYPTSTTLASGQVLTSLGTTGSGNSELWTQDYGWQVLDNVDLKSYADFDYNYNDWYPALNVSPDGSLFHPGPNNEIYSINLDQDDALTAHGAREVNGSDRLYNTTVLYDVGKMLVAGGGQQDAKNSAITIDLNGATPVVEPTDSMKYARAMQNSVVLPNGEVLVVGGNSSGIQFSDNGTVLTPEIWNPDTGEWREVAAHTKPRNYHSTALLLQDGRVLSMGGGLCGDCKTNHQDGQIYEPPYLFSSTGERVARPSITAGAENASAGDALTLTGSDDIVEFNMVRLVAVTHHHSTDQRLVPVPFNKVGAGNYELQLNDNPNVLIPGYYWIFGLDQNGVPSVGHQIKIETTTAFYETPAATETNIEYSYYHGLWNALPDFSTLTPVATGTQSNFSLNNRQRNWAYGFQFSGFIDVPEDGEYTFYLASDDGSRLSIDGNVVVNHDGNHRFEAVKSGATFLTAGKHEIEVEFYEGGAGDGLLVSWSSDNMPKRPVTKFDLGSEVIDLNGDTVSNEPVITDVPGATDSLVTYSYYEGTWSKVPDFDSLTAIETGVLANFSLSPKNRDDYYGFRFDSTITVNADGEYTFYTASDDGSNLYIDGQLVAGNDGTHATRERSGKINLAAGKHSIRVEYFETDGGDNLKVFWSGPGFEKQLMADSVFVDSGSVIPEPSESLVNYSYYEGTWNKVPDFDTLNPLKTGVVKNFSLAPKETDDFYGFRFDGRITVNTDGAYTFYTISDDGSNLYIDGQLVVGNDGLHAMRKRNGVVTLTAGEHDIRVEYFEKAGGDGLQVSWSGPDFDKQVIPDSAFVKPVAVTPDTSDSLISYSYYEGNWDQLPEFDSLTATKTGNVDEFSVAPRDRDDFYAFRFDSNITVNVDGNYTFYTRSDDGSKLYIDDQLVVDNDGLHGVREESAVITLAAGDYDIRVEFFEKIGGDSLQVLWNGPGFEKTKLIPGDSLTTPVDINSNSGLTPQLNYEYFEGAWLKLPDFDSLQPIGQGVVNNFNLSVKGAVNQYGVRFLGQLEIETAGEYTFYVRSNDGTKLSLAGELVVDNDGRHGAIEKQGAVTLTTGTHPVELTYFQNGGSEALQVFWSGPGFDKELVPDSVLFQQ